MELIRLPSPPHILSELLDVCHDPDSSAADLATLISVDPALTIKLIMAMNSHAFDIHEPARDMEQVVTLVGPDLVKNMVITSAIQQLFAGLINSQKEYVCNAWLDSLYCAVFARDIAIAIGYEQPGDAYLAGMLHDLGQIVFDAKYHDQYVKIINLDTEAKTIAQEVSMFGESHTELGASIIEQWPSVNPAIADAVRFHHEDEAQLAGSDILCQIVAEASLAARHWSHAGRADSDWHPALVTEKDLKNIYLHVQDKVMQTAVALGISLPRSSCLTQEHLSRDIEKETIKLARKIRDASLIKVINLEETHVPSVNSPRALVAKVAQEMQLFFSVADLVLLYHDPTDPEYLTLHEIGRSEPVSKFKIEGNAALTTRCFAERQRIWLEPGETDAERTAVTDRQILRRLKHDIGLACPIAYEDEIIGVIIVGAHRTQKNTLDKLANIISSYLKNVADTWLRNRHSLNEQSLADSARKEYEQRDIDKLIHEISNPLSVIGNYIEIVRVNAETGDGGSPREIDLLKEELQRIRNIVLEFKDAKASDPSAVFLNVELETSIPLYVKSFGEEKDVQVLWELDRDDAQIDITRDALRQIILNLVKNAIEAQTDDAAIMVSSRSFVNINGRTYAQFSIADRGRGVHKDRREHLFSPLISAKEGPGRGLGLSVIADLLKRFDGQIQYMKNEAGGALFEVLIPLSVKP